MAKVKLDRSASTPPGNIAIVSGSTGAGHDSVAKELAVRLSAIGYQSQIIDILQCMPIGLGRVIRNAYYITATRAPLLLKLAFQSTQSHRDEVPGASRLIQRLTGYQLAREISTASLAISFHPYATQALGGLKEQNAFRGNILNYITDFAPHDQWINKQVATNMTITEETALAVRAIYGVKAVSAGPLVAQKFRTAVSNIERNCFREKLGILDRERMALVVAGSHGIGAVARTANAVRLIGLRPVVVCGRNTHLRDRLVKDGIISLGWRDDMHQLMHAADVLIHNAGGLSLTEAMAIGLPAVTFMPVAGHGVVNAEFLAAAGLAMWARSTEELKNHCDIAVRRPRRPIPIECERTVDLVSKAMVISTKAVNQSPEGRSRFDS